MYLRVSHDTHFEDVFRIPESLFLFCQMDICDLLICMDTSCARKLFYHVPAAEFTFMYDSYVHSRSYIVNISQSPRRRSWNHPPSFSHESPFVLNRNWTIWLRCHFGNWKDSLLTIMANSLSIDCFVSFSQLAVSSTIQADGHTYSRKGSRGSSAQT